MKLENFSFVKNPKLILYTTILVVVLFFIIKYILKNIKKSDDQKIIGAVNSEINSSNLSFTSAEFKIMADRLETAMRGAGTDENTIYQILGQLQNKDDWFQLVSAFGVRSYGNWFYTAEGTLPHWLDTELITEEKTKVLEILLKIGVTI